MFFTCVSYTFFKFNFACCTKVSTCLLTANTGNGTFQFLIKAELFSPSQILQTKCYVYVTAELHIKNQWRSRWTYPSHGSHYKNQLNPHRTWAPHRWWSNSAELMRNQLQFWTCGFLAGLHGGDHHEWVCIGFPWLVPYNQRGWLNVNISSCRPHSISMWCHELCLWSGLSPVRRCD